MKFTDNFQLLATSPAGVERLRDLILTLAMKGKLVPQCSTDEPAERLMTRIRAERSASNDGSKLSKPSKAISDEETPFELPDGWTWVRLGDVCSYIQRGKGPKYAEQSDYPVVSQKCVRWYGLDLAQARFIEPESMGGYDNARILRLGDILWNSTGTGTIGRAVVVPSDLPFSKLVADSHVTVVRPVLVLSNFIWRWIQSPFVQAEIEGMASGSTNQIELATSTVVAHLLPLPPLAEQARIVAKLNELMHLCDGLETRGQLEAKQHARLTRTLFDALAASESPHALAENWARVAAHFDLLLDRPEAVDALEKTILELAVRGLLLPIDERNGTTSLLDETTTATFVEQADGAADESPNVAPYEIPSSWSWIKFGEIMCDLRYGTSAKCDYEVKGTPVLRIPNLKNGRISTDDLKFGALTPEEAARLSLVPGDLLLIRSNGSATLVGSAALVGEECRDFAFAGYLMRIRLREEVALPTYILLALETEGVRTLIEGPIRTTSGVKNINSTEVSRLQFPLPPLETQRRIVDRVDDLRRLCADLRERLSARPTCQAHFAEALVGQAASTAPLVGNTDDLPAAA